MKQKKVTEKSLFHQTMVMFFMFLLSSMGANAQIVLHDATNVTQTKTTLSANFPDLSAEHGFQYKYGTIPALDDFSSVLLSPTSDPVSFSQGGKNWRTVNSRGWVESFYDDTSSKLTSDFSATITLTEKTTISYEWKVSSQENVGMLQFVVDGTVALSITGEIDFTPVSYELTSGEHTIKWQYVRNTTESTGDGIGRLRNLNIQNTTAGKWLDWPTTNSITRLENLYPSQDYIFRAYNATGEANEILYSGIKSFTTLPIGYESVSVSSITQTTCTINASTLFGDAPTQYNMVFGKKKEKKKCSSLEAAILPYDERDSTLIDFTFSGNWTKFPSSSGIITRSNNASVSATFILSEASVISFGWTATAYDTYNGAHIQADCYVDGIKRASLTWNGWDGYDSNHGADLALEAGEHTITWKVSYPYSTTDYFRLTGVSIPNVSVFSEIGERIEDISLPHKKEGLIPNTKYAMYIEALPNYDSDLEQRWSGGVSPLLDFLTLNVSPGVPEARNISQTSTIICAEISKGDATIISKGFQYKIETGDTWMNTNTTEKRDSIFAQISSLKPSTVYAFRSYIQAAGCNTIYSDTQTFTTASVQAIMPLVISTTQTTAELQGRVETGGTEIYSCGMQFKAADSEEDWTTKEYNGEGETFIFNFSNLKVGAPYMARTYVERIGGTIYSDILVFNTKGIELYVDKITDVYQRSAVVHGRFIKGDAQLTDWKINLYSSTGSSISLVETYSMSADSENFEKTITGLTPNSSYVVNLTAEIDDRSFNSEYYYKVPTITSNTESFTSKLLKSNSSTNIICVHDNAWFEGDDRVYLNSRISSGYHKPLTVTVELEEPTAISFSWGVSGRGGLSNNVYADLYFALDGSSKASITTASSYSVDKSYSITIPAGRHTLKWESCYDYVNLYAYIKDLYIPQSAIKMDTFWHDEYVLTSPGFFSQQRSKDVTQTTSTLQAIITPTNEEGVEYYFCYKRSLAEIAQEWEFMTEEERQTWSNDFDVWLEKTEAQEVHIPAIIQDNIFTATINNLTPNTDYKYYAVARTSDGNKYDEEINFKTLPVTVSLSYNNVTQTSATVRVTTDAGTASIENMQYRLNYGEWQSFTDNSINLTGLIPDTSYRFDLQWGVSGLTYSDYISFKTTSVSIDAGVVTPLQTSALVEMGSVNVGTATKTASGIVFDDKTYTLNPGETMRLTELTPNTYYSYTYFVDTKEGGRASYTQSFTTKAINMETSDASSISNRSATMNGTIDCDSYSSTEFGFQWKQMEGWNSDPAFTKGVKNEGGSISVALVNGILEPNTDYQYRTAVRYKGQIYYANNWETFRTESEYVYYPASVYTVFRTDRENNRLILCGYYIAGSETVTSQGYEYWSTQSNARSYGLASAPADNVVTITTDESMQYSLDMATLANGNYSVRAFVVTSSGIKAYGETLSFGVQNGIDAIENIAGERVSVSASGTTLTIHNATSLVCSIYSINGSCITQRKLMNDEEKFELSQHNVYIVRLSNGKNYKIKL